MQGNNEILDAISAVGRSVDSLRNELDARVRVIERRLKLGDYKLRRVTQFQEAQQEQIDELRKRLDEMSPIWQSKDGKRIAFDRNGVYEAAKMCGMSAHDALIALEMSGILYRGADGKRTSAVRPFDAGRPVRAVVIVL